MRFRRCIGRLLVGLLAVAAVRTADAAEFGCLQPDYRDGSFMVQGAWDVVDGDTVKIGDFTVHLISIVAPSIEQKCLSQSGAVFECGRTVQQMLSTKFGSVGPTATCLVHYLRAEHEGEGFCGTFVKDPHLGVECIERDFGGELARDGYANVTAVGEFPTSSLYWAGYLAQKERRGLFAGQILPMPDTQP